MGASADEVLAVDPVLSSPDEVLGHALALERIVARAQARQVRTFAHLDAYPPVRSASRVDEARDKRWVRKELACLLTISPGVAGARLSTAPALVARVPASLELVDDGSIRRSIHPALSNVRHRSDRLAIDGAPVRTRRCRPGNTERAHCAGAPSRPMLREPTTMTILYAIVGAIIVMRTWVSVLSVLVVPRRSRDRLSRLVNRSVEAIFRSTTRRIDSYLRRDRLLAGQAATVILTQLAVWLMLFYLGFALILQSFGSLPVSDSFAQAGSSLFTLGYAGPTDASLSAVDYVAAASGLIVVALQIGYLPTLYGAFNRRETEVTLLSSRAGTPAWGPELLARTRFGFDAEDDGAVMDQFYLQWERWAADVSESHSNYPVLTAFRSPAKYASWLVALVAVLDSAALWLAISPSSAPAVEARLALRMGFLTLWTIGETLDVTVEHDPDPDGPLQLDYADYLAGVQRIASTTFTMERTAEQAWPDFRGWRVNYEAIAYALADRLDAVPAPWTGPRRNSDQPMAPIRPSNRKPTPFGGPVAD